MRFQYYLICICLFLVGMASSQAQTQYIGPNNGDWFTVANWNNGLPAAGNNALIGGGVTVVVGSPLNVNFTITNFGGITANAAVTIAAGGTVSSSGTLSVSATGSLTNNGSLQNFGTMTFAGASGFTNETGATFTNGGNFTLQTTLVNRGAVTNNGTIDAANGTLQTQGTFDNNQSLTTKSLTVNAGSTFTNNFGATLNTTGATGNLLVNGNFTNNGTVNASGTATVNGVFNNNVQLNVAAATVLTVNAAAQLTNAGTLDNQGFVQNYGLFTNGNTLINKGEANNFGQLNNNNLIDNRTGASFFNRPGGTFGMGFGSRFLNAGTFDNKDAFNSFGTVENNSTFLNNGTFNGFSGINGVVLDNNSSATNNGIINTNDKVPNDGNFTNNGTINVNNGSVWSNNATFTNSTTGTVNVVQDFINTPTGVLTNNGTFRNTVRTRNEGSFTNNAFLSIIGNSITNAVGATLTNNELLYLQAGNLLNEGTLVNTDKIIVDGCSSLNNKGAINNTGGNLELRGIFFQTGTQSGNPVNNQGGYTHTSPTPPAPSLCKNGTFGTDINGDIKVYAQELISFANSDSCANVIYLANGQDRPVFLCSDIGTVQNVNVEFRTTMNDILTCTAQVTLVDLLAPEFSDCPKDIVIFTPNSTATAIWTAPTAIDNCSTVTLTSTFNPGASFPVGITGVTYNATDIYNNQNQCQFRIDVRQTAPGSNCTGDTAGPTFTGCPPNQNVQAVGNLTPVTWAPPTPNDNCKPITMTTTHIPGQAFPVGTTTVIYTAKDGNNNAGTCQFNVTVTAVNLCQEDGQKPVISGCPANIWLPTNLVINGAVAIWNAPGAGDNCGVTSFTSNFAPGSIFPVGTTTVTYTAKDAANNTATCNFTITVGADPCPGDVTAPAISGCPANITILTTGVTALGTWTAPTANDPCAPVTVNNTHSSGSTFGLGVTPVTYQFSDKKGNTSTCTFTVTVQNACSVDNVAPAITGCPANITVPAVNGSGVATWTPPTATDNCGLSSFSSSYLPGASFPVGTTTVVYSAIDLKGNGASCSFNVTVVSTPGCTTNAAPINNSTDVNPASVTLSWNAASGASSYDVYLGTTNPPTTVTVANVSGTSATVTNLSGGTTYYWYVVPKNAAGSATGCASGTTQFSTSGTSGDCNKNALFVVGSTTLNASDAAVKSRLESLGYTVTVKDDKASATTDATGKGLVILSSTCKSDEVKAKFRNVTVPVINYESQLMDHMKMTTGSNLGTSGSISQIVIQTPSHDMAAGLTGTVTVFSLSGTVTWGNPTAAAVRIGYVPGNSGRAMIFGYETGAAMAGINAPARRVGFFLHDNTATNLNANGLKLFDAAVFWASGCPPCTLEPTAVCKNITLQLTAIGQSVQINGQQVDGGSTPGCTGTILTYNVSPTSFSQPGTYTATLTVTNSLGLSSTCTSTVTVLAPPCDNATNGGIIAKTCVDGQVQLLNSTLPIGGSGTIEYLWISGTTDCDPDNMDPVSGGNGPNLIVGNVGQTTYFIRCSRRSGCTDWDGESNCQTVYPSECLFDPNKCYRIVAKHSGKALKLKNGSNNNGDLVVQATFDQAVAHNRWKFENLGNGLFKIVNVQSGKVLDVSGASMADGANIQQWSYGGGDNQKWKVMDQGGGEFRIEAKHSGKVLDIYGGSTADNAQAIQWPWHGGDNQRFYIQEVACTNCDNDVLFVVGNTTLNTGDTWVKNRLQTLGYTVTLKSATACGSEDANGKGLVVISSTVNSGDIGTKFTNVTVPVVTWESYLLDDLKMVSNSEGSGYGQNGNYNSLSISDASHPLAAGLSGTVQVYTSSNLMRWGWTTNGSAAKVAKIAGQSSRYGVFGYESGVPMQGGFIAPARRVSLFMDDATPTLLTANGIKLFDAAINWAAKCNGQNFNGDAPVEARENEATFKNETTREITVYPNPTAGSMFVTLERFEGKEVLIRLFDTNGRSLKEWNVTPAGEPVLLEPGDLMSGQYLLWIFAAGEAPVTRRVMVERTR
ncbi:MAG: HYR domain-containing protein [Bacteroidetes bacterium]|nr:HYR domain-containing protein [Bacteroidota bacterium]